jgi:hypothetical protein
MLRPHTDIFAFGAVVMECTTARMIQAGNGLCFALKSHTQLGTVSKTRKQNLDGDNSIEARIPGPINLAHPARTDSGKYFIGPETAAGKDGQGLRPI